MLALDVDAAELYSKGKYNLADITKLIDVVYISKNPPDPCI